MNSSTIRSCEMMLSLLACRLMLSSVSLSMENSSWLANRMARSIRRGSSQKVVSGSSGVRITPPARSSSPPKRSIISSCSEFFTSTASALMVKSRRWRSSSSVAFSTMGLRESARYDSFRAPTNSTSRCWYIRWAVPKFLKYETWGRPIRAATSRASSRPEPTVTMSRS